MFRAMFPPIFRSTRLCVTAFGIMHPRCCPPIFRSTRLCVTACGIMHPRCCRPVAWKLCFQANGQQHCGCIIPQAVTQSLVLLKMGVIQHPKHVELIGIINKPLLLHLVGVYIIYINDARSSKYQRKKKLLGCTVQGTVQFQSPNFLCTQFQFIMPFPNIFQTIY